MTSQTGHSDHRCVAMNRPGSACSSSVAVGANRRTNAPDRIQNHGYGRRRSRLTERSRDSGGPTLVVRLLIGSLGRSCITERVRWAAAAGATATVMLTEWPPCSPTISRGRTILRRSFNTMVRSVRSVRSIRARGAAGLWLLQVRTCAGRARVRCGQRRTPGIPRSPRRSDPPDPPRRCVLDLRRTRVSPGRNLRGRVLRRFSPHACRDRTRVRRLGLRWSTVPSCSLRATDGLWSSRSAWRTSHRHKHSLWVCPAVLESFMWCRYAWLQP